MLTPSINTPVRRLSGGNVQKVLVGREIAQNPSVLMTAYAVRGLDINTSYTIYNLLTAQKLKGVAVIYVGEDLDVMMARRKKSLGELAQKVDITMANLSILKNNKARAIRFSTLEAICAALDCQPGDILEFVPEEGDR